MWGGLAEKSEKCCICHAGQQQQQFEEGVQQRQEEEQRALQAQQALPQQRHLATKLLHPPASTDDPYEAVAPPLYQTATFGQPSATTNGPYDYTRSGNPTRTQLETQMADLEVRQAHLGCYRYLGGCWGLRRCCFRVFWIGMCIFCASSSCPAVWD